MSLANNVWVPITFSVAGEHRVRYANVKASSVSCFADVMDAFIQKHVSLPLESALSCLVFFFNQSEVSRHEPLVETPENLSLLLITVYPQRPGIIRPPSRLSVVYLK
jgi:hypothetical protein